MPDLNGRRKSKTDSLKKLDNSSKSKQPSLKSGEKRKPERSANRSPVKRRAPQRTRSSSSDTSGSDSSSSSGSSDSSASSSSRSSSESPKKAVQAKPTKKPETPKVTQSRTEKSKTESQPAHSAKLSDNRSNREPPKKLIDDSSKSNTAPRIDNRDTSGTVVEDAASAVPRPVKSSVDDAVEKTDTGKTQPVSKAPSKPSKPSAVEIDKNAKERSRSPAAIPPFTRVLVEKLTRNVNKAHITEIFSVWGEISSVEMPPDRLHPEFSRCYAYITYADPKCASDAVNFMNGGQIDGEVIRVTEVFSRPSTSARAGGDTGETSHHRDRVPTRREPEKPSDSNRDRKPEAAPVSHRRTADSSERPRDRERPGADMDRRKEMQDRRERERERERQRDRSRDLDRPRRARRGSSGSPFAGRMAPSARQRSPISSSRYRRTSPANARPMPARRGRSRSPKDLKPKQTGRSSGGGGAKPPVGRRGRNVTRSSSTSSSASGTSNSSSSSSRSGSSSSSSSSSSSRSHT